MTATTFKRAMNGTGTVRRETMAVVAMSRLVKWIKFRAAGKCVGGMMRGEDGTVRLLGIYTNDYEIRYQDGRTERRAESTKCPI